MWRGILAGAASTLVLASALTASPAPGAPADDPPPAWTAAKALTVSLGGSNGVSRARGTGLGCDGAQAVDDVHVLVEDDVAGGVLSSLPARGRANLGVAGDRLVPATSHVTLGDDRGTLRLGLDGGACPVTNLLTGGLGVAGSGPLAVRGGTGAYRSATLTGGTWSLSAALDPGADNPWELDLAGDVAVLAPSLEVEVVDAWWGNLGLDYLTRTVTVAYRITNPGPGDAFGTIVTAATGGAGVTALGPVPQSLGDLLAGESRNMVVRYQLGLLQPCDLVVLGCSFGTEVTVSLPDALDAPATLMDSAGATAPALPPPL